MTKEKVDIRHKFRQIESMSIDGGQGNDNEAYCSSTDDKHGRRRLRIINIGVTLSYRISIHRTIDAPESHCDRFVYGVLLTPTSSVDRKFNELLDNNFNIDQSKLQDVLITDTDVKKKSPPKDNIIVFELQDQIDAYKRMLLGESVDRDERSC